MPVVLIPLRLTRRKFLKTGLAGSMMVSRTDSSQTLKTSTPAKSGVEPSPPPSSSHERDLLRAAVVSKVGNPPTVLMFNAVGGSTIHVTGAATVNRPADLPQSASFNWRPAMKKRRSLLLSFLLGAPLVVCICATSSSPPLRLRVVKDLPLPGRTTRFDYESLDPNKGLLFIAHLGDSTVLAFDIRSEKLVGEIPGVAAVHGVLAVPSLNRVYASATGTDEVVAIDESSFRIMARISGGHYPDGLAFDATTQELFVSDEHGRTDTVINTNTQQRIATIPLGGEAGNTQFDAVGGRMYVAVQTLNRLVAIDPKSRAVVAEYPLPGCEHDHGLYIDAPRRLAFVACEGNARLLTFDLRTMRVTGAHSVGKNPDVLAFDADLRRLYVASERGVVTEFQEEGLGAVKLGESYVAPKAHSLAVDSEHRVYIPLQELNGRPVLRLMAPTTR
jgi:DNA-binding beta-propeller fold protein YncE